MNTLLTKAWILICSVLVSGAATDHTSSHHHEASHHGGSPPHQKPHSIVPFGIQIPEHVLSTRDVACISADENIFEIMNKAQESCNGTDMRCTFYQFLNHDYHNIGTLDVNKELFDDLLAKFDNWLLTAEKIETKEGSSLDTASVNVNDGLNNEGKVDNSSDPSALHTSHTSQGKLDNNTHVSDDNPAHSHHMNNRGEKHQRNHHHKWKTGNHIKLDPLYNKDHKYFEVLLPKDKETGKQKTIYVEVDKDKNEFVLIDEDIDEKLKGFKPIKIELDELSEIADKAFSVVKTLNYKEHIYNQLNDIESDVPSDIDTHSEVNEDEHLDIDLDEHEQNILNPSVCNPSICNIDAYQQLIPKDSAGPVKKIVNASKNLIVPNTYMNHAQFHVESHIDNTTDEMPDDYMEILESNNTELDIHTDYYENEPLDSIEWVDSNNSTDIDLNNRDNSYLNNTEVPVDNDDDNNFIEHYESIEHENVTIDDDSCIQLDENNDTYSNVEFDDVHELPSSYTEHVDESSIQVEKPVQETHLNITPNISNKPELTSFSTAEISDHIGSQLDTIHAENRGHTDLQDNSGLSTPLPPCTAVPILGKDLAKVLLTDSHLQSSFPAYTTLDSPTATQNTLLYDDVEHPNIVSYNSPLESRPNICQYTSPNLPSPPIEYVERLNKGSKYSPLNSGFSWQPYSHIDELRLPCTLNPLSSPQDSFLPLPVPMKETFSSSQTWPGSTIPVGDSSLLSTVSSLGVGVQKPSFTIPRPPNQVMPSTPSVMSNSLKEANLPYSFQYTPSLLESTKPKLDDGFVKCSPFDYSSEETMIPCVPCSGMRNRYPYPTIPYSANPYLTPLQYIPSYTEPLLPGTPLKLASKNVNSDYLPLPNQCLEGDYPLGTKPIPFLPWVPNYPFSPLNPLILGPGFPSNYLNNPNLLNNIPYLPYTVLPDQNIRNYPNIVGNYLTPSAALQPSQIFKPSLSKGVAPSIFEPPCSSNNMLEITPPSYAPFLPVRTEISPSVALERDLQSLSLKYGIPLAKILNTLETEITDNPIKTCSPTLYELPSSKLKLDHSVIKEQLLTLPITNKVGDDKFRSGNEELLSESDLADFIPLDSSLIGPHLDKENTQVLDANDSQNYTVLPETTAQLTNPSTTTLHDSSVFVPHLSTLSTSNFQINDENRIVNEELILESDISNLTPLDSSLIGPHLHQGSPPVVVDSNHLQGEILLPHTEVSTLVEQKLNSLNQPSSVRLDSLVSPIKPSISNEIQSINEMTLLESDLTEVTPIDSSHVDLVNELTQSEISQHEISTVSLAASELQEVTESLPSNSIEGELLLESDSTSLVPLDSSLIGPGLKLGSLPIVTDSAKGKSVPLKSQESSQNTDVKIEELENIILPSTMLQKLLGTPTEGNLNLNVHTQDKKLNGEIDRLKLETNIELPLTDISLTPYKETDFEMVESASNLPSLDSNIITLSKDSTTLKHNSKSPVTVAVDSKRLLDSSLTGPSLFHNIEAPEMSSTIDSSVQLDSSLIVPGLLQEIEPSLISPFDSGSHLESSVLATTFDQSIKPSDTLTAIDSKLQLDSSLIGPSLHQDSKNTLHSVSQLDSSFIVPSLHKTIESSATLPAFDSSYVDSTLLVPILKPEMKVIEASRVFDTENILDSSLIGPHLSTKPFSNDEIKMIKKALLTESLIPLDSSLIGQSEQSEISRYEYPELSLTSKTTDFLPSDSVSDELPLESDALSIFISDLQELLSKYTNPTTVHTTQLSPSQIKSRDKSLSSIAEISTNNINVLTSSAQGDLASLSSPKAQTVSGKECSSIESILEQHPNLIPNYFQAGTLAQSPYYTQGIPQIPITPSSPFVQMKPVIGYNWLAPTPNFQNILPSSVGTIPVSNIVESAPVPLTSNTFKPMTSEDLKTFSNLASQSNLYPQSSFSNIYPEEAIAPTSSVCTTPSNILPQGQYIPLHPQKLPVLPSNLEYNPIVVDDITSLIDEKNTQLLKDMSILPFSETEKVPSILKYEKGEMISPTLLESRPVFSMPITNPLVPSSVYPNPQLYNPQSIPYMIQTPCNLHPYSHKPLNTQFSEAMGPAPELVSLPTESPNTLHPASQLYEIPHMSQFSESVTNPRVDNQLLQELLSKLCLDSSIVVPSASLDTKLQLSTALNELNTVPSNFIPISPTFTSSSSSAFTSPSIPSYTSPSSVSYAKPISTSSTYSPSNMPYSASSLLTEFTSPLTSLSTIPLSNYSYLPTVLQNRPISPAVPYKPSEIYSSPYLPVHSPLPNEISSLPLTFKGKLIPTMTNPESPPLLAPYFSPVPKSINNFDIPAYSGPVDSLTAIPPTQTGLMSTSYLPCPDTTSHYLPLPAPINALKQPSSMVSPTYLNPILPVCPSLLPYNRIVPSSPIMTPELPILRPINTLPSSYGDNPFLHANKMPPLSPNNLPLPIQSYPMNSKSIPYSNSQLMENIPYGDVIETNLETPHLIEETPYDAVEEIICTYSNDKVDKYHEEPHFKYPYLPDEETTPTYVEDFIISTPVTGLASEQAKLYQRPLTPFTQLHDKPLQRPCSIPQLLPLPTLMETIPPYILENGPLIPFSTPLKRPDTLPTSVSYNPLLRPLAPITLAPNFFTSPPFVPDTLKPVLSMNENLFISSPYYPAPIINMPSPPRELKDTLTPQVPTNAPFMPVSSPIKSQTPTSPYIQLPLTYNELKSMPLTSQGSIVKPYTAPILSYIPPPEIPVSSQYITPLTSSHSTKQHFSPHSPSSLPAQTILPLNEAPTQYQPHIPHPTGLDSAADIFRGIPGALPYAVSPSVNNMVKPVSIDGNSPQWSPLTPQYSLPSPTSVPLSIPITRPSNVPYSGICPQFTKQALSNHIIPSSLFMSSDTDYQTLADKLSLLHNIPRYSSPLPSLIEPLEIAPFVMPSRLLGKISYPQNIKKPETPFFESPYTVPLLSSPYLTKPSDPYLTQPYSDVQHTYPNLSSVKAQNASPASSPIYTCLPLETTSNPTKNRPSAPPYSFSRTPVYDTPIYSSPVGRHPCLNSIPEVPSYPCPNYPISSLKITPESILLSNLRPLGIPQESLNLYSSPITSSVPLSSSSLLAPLLQKSCQYHLPIIPSKSQFVSQSPMDSVSELLPFTSPLLKSPQLKPYDTSLPNNGPLLPLYSSNTATTFPNSVPLKYSPSVTDSHQYLSPSELLSPKSSLSTTPYTLLKSPFIKQYQSPTAASTNMPLYSNYDILESSPKFPINRNVNIAKPIDTPSFSLLESSPLSHNLLDMENVEEIESYGIRPDLKDIFAPLLLGLTQETQLHPALSPQYATSRPKPSPIPFLIPEEAEIIDTTGFVPMSPVHSEPLHSYYSPTDRNKPPLSFQEPDVLQLHPYTTLPNSDSRPPTYKRVPPKSQYPNYLNQTPLLLPSYISPQEYKELTQGLSPSQASSSSSSPFMLTPTNKRPQLITSPSARGPSPTSLMPFNTSPMSLTSGNWLQSPNDPKNLPLHEKPFEGIPIMYSPDRITPKPREINYPFELLSSIHGVPSELGSVKPLVKSKESYTEYIESPDSSEENDNILDPSSVSLVDEIPDDLEAKSFTKSLPEIIKGFSIPDYNIIANRPQRLSKLDHFYENNQIGKSPQLLTVPTYNTLPMGLSEVAKRPSSLKSPDVYEHFTNIPTKYAETVTELDSSSLRPNVNDLQIAKSLKADPTMTPYVQNNLNQCIKSSPYIKSPPTTEFSDTSNMSNQPTTYIPIEDIKYSGYKTYQIPSRKSETPTHIYTPYKVPYSPPIIAEKLSNVQQNSSPSNFYEPTEMYEPQIPQYQAPITTTPLQTKLGLDNLQESPDLNEDNLINETPICADSTNEDNELKSSLINYINGKDDFNNIFDDNNDEITIPLGNIAITKKEPCKTNTIETNNPSIGLKVWKSKIKIAKADLKLKFKDLSVNNFMPVVNNIDKYDMEEIRKLVKTYIDEKYGKHIEVNEPYTVDNKYTVIKDFDHNAVDSKYNLLWPTHYV